MALSSRIVKHSCRSLVSAHNFVAVFLSRAREQAVFGKVTDA